MPDTVYGNGGGWWSKVLLEPLSAPPAERIVSPGARFVLVSEPLSAPPPRQSHYGLILAWASLRPGWACLLVWDGYRRGAHGRDVGASARWSWVRWQGDLVTYHQPWPDQPEGLRWFGRHHGDDMELALYEAAASLPEAMRDAALVPMDYSGPPTGISYSGCT